MTTAQPQRSRAADLSVVTLISVGTARPPPPSPPPLRPPPPPLPPCMSSRTQKNLKAPAARASGWCGCCALPFLSTRSRLARRSDVAINLSTKTGFTHFRSLVMPRASGELVWAQGCCKTPP
ncbi:hypothetical protein AOLI_G00226020 [Acnodon oligacanthus]